MNLGRTRLMRIVGRDTYKHFMQACIARSRLYTTPRHGSAISRNHLHRPIYIDLESHLNLISRAVKREVLNKIVLITGRDTQLWSNAGEVTIPSPSPFSGSQAIKLKDNAGTMATSINVCQSAKTDFFINMICYNNLYSGKDTIKFEQHTHCVYEKQ